MRRLSTRVSITTLAINVLMLLLFIVFFLIGTASGMRNWQERVKSDLEQQVEEFILDWLHTHPNTGLLSIEYDDVPESIIGISSHLLVLNADEEVVLSFRKNIERPEGEKRHAIWRILNTGTRKQSPLSTVRLQVRMDGEVVALFTVGSVPFHAYRYANLTIESIVNLFLPFSISALFLSLISGHYLSRVTAKSADRLSKRISKLVDGEQNVIFVEEPITELNSISESVRTLHKRLVAATVSQRQWIDDISHDLKTPISAMQIQLEGILDGVFEPDSQRIEKLLSELTHIGTLVEKFMFLMCFSRPDIKLNLETIDLQELLCTLLPAYEDLAR